MRHWLETFGAETHPFPTATVQVAMASKRTLVALTPAEKVRVLNLRSEAAAAMAAGVGNHWWPLDQSSRPQVDQASGVASGSSQTSGAHHASRTPAAGFIAAGPSGAAAGSSQTPAAGSDPETRNSSGAAEVGWRAVAESVDPTKDVSHGADQVVTLTPAEKMRVLNDAFGDGKELVVHFTNLQQERWSPYPRWANGRLIPVEPVLLGSLLAWIRCGVNDDAGPSWCSRSRW